MLLPVATWFKNAFVAVKEFLAEKLREGLALPHRASLCREAVRVWGSNSLHCQSQSQVLSSAEAKFPIRETGEGAKLL